MSDYVAVRDQLSPSLAGMLESEIKPIALYPVAFVSPRGHLTTENPGDLTVYAVRRSNLDERGVAFRTAVANCVAAWYYDHSQVGSILYKSAGAWRLFCYGRHWGPVIAKEALIGQLDESVLARIDAIVKNALYHEDMDRAFYGSIGRRDRDTLTAESGLRQ